MLSFDTASLCTGTTCGGVALVENDKFFPNRSKSSTGMRLRLVVQMQKPLRSRSMPLLPRKGVSKKEQEALSCPSIPLASVPHPPSLCRWSSDAPLDQKANSFKDLTKYTSAPAMPLRSLRSLPPRLPKRRSGRAEELRAALPPRVPLRKPGVATVDSKALPPFKPRRCYFEDSCDNMSLVSSLTMDSFALPDEDDCSEESVYELLPFCFGTPLDGSAAKQNLRDVLGTVLDQLDFDSELS